MKKTIGIDINEILRARSMQFDRYYVQEFGEEGCPDENDAYKYDLRNDYVWEDGFETINYLNEDLPENISPKDYQIDKKTGKAPVDAFAFKSETEFISANDKYKKFMYEDFVLEIHGLAPLIYPTIGKDLEKFYMQYKDQFNIKIVSKENWFTIPPTLYFLSKVMPRLNKFEFFDNNNDLLESIDILLTTDPELLKTNSSNKKIIKIKRPYNVDIDCEFESLQLIELVDNDEFQRLINYKK